MAKVVKRILGYFGLLLGFLMWASTSLAHRLDEYLQATLVIIEPGELKLQINLTPGVDVADQVLALIDRNHDGKISTNEAAAYSELLKKDLLLRLDQRKLALNLSASNFPPPTELRTGWGIIQVEFSASVGRLAPGTHRLTLKNRHLPASSVYLFNAAQPTSSSVHITGQKRNETQSAGEIEFTIAGQAKASGVIGAIAALAENEVTQTFSLPYRRLSSRQPYRNPARGRLESLRYGRQECLRYFENACVPAASASQLTKVSGLTCESDPDCGIVGL